MKINLKTKLASLGVIALSIVGALGLAQPTYADSITDKSQAYVLSRCANSGVLMSPVYSEYWSGYNSWVNIYASNSYPILSSGNVNGTTDYADYLSCSEAVLKYSNNIPSANASLDTLNTFFSNLGYTITDDDASGRCATFNFANTDGRTHAIKMCANLDANGHVKDDSISVTHKNDSGSNVIEAADITVKKKDHKVELDCNIRHKPTGLGNGGCTDHSYEGKTFEEFAQEVLNDIQQAAGNNGGTLGRYDLTPTSATPDFANYGDITKIYSTNSVDSKALLSTLTGYGSGRELILSNDEKLNLLSNYLKNYYGISYYLGDESKACNLTDDARANAEAAGYKRAMISATKECYITARNNGGDTVAAYNRDGYPDGTEISFDELVQRINDLIPNEVDKQIAAKTRCNDRAIAKRDDAISQLQHTSIESEQQKARDFLDAFSKMNGVYWEEGADGSITCKVDTLEGNTEPSFKPSTPNDVNNSGSDNNASTSSGGDLTECLNNAGSLGWILCPILNIVKVTVEGFYDDIETNWLPIENNYVRAGDGEPIYDGWKVVRTFANIVFVVVLGIIILSQLTGIGLSNYSIKKTLPTIIIVAVLVNLSFLICQLLVDVTNIIGAEAGKMLAEIGARATNGTADIGFGTVVKGAISTIFSFAGIGAAGIGIGVAVVSNPGLLIPILISGIGIIISLFFFFAILAIRKAGVYIMIILSPLAFICYALPNTKNIFDKWKRILTALLLVYPICQILTGGGQMISHIMLANHNEGFTYNIVAVVLSFAPIFFIPSIIRSSMTALGNLGNRMNMLGNRFRTGVTGSLRRSDTVQRAQTSLGNFGATQGENLLGRVNNRLRNARGIGGLVRGIEDSKLGNVMKNQRARGRNQRIANYQKMMLGDNEAAYLSENLDPDQALQNKIDKQNIDLRNQLVEDAMQSIAAGNASYDGNAINPDDASEDGSMSSALDYFWNRYNSADGSEGDLIMAQALMRRMIETGDTTRTHAMKKLHDRAFDQNGNAVSSVDKATSALSKYISNNGQWMAKLKAEDNGSFQLVSQLAQNGYSKLGRSAINTIGAKSLRPNQVGDLSDRFFDSMDSEIQSGTFRKNYDAASSIITMDNVFQQAMSNAQTRGNIKPDEIRRMNELHKEAYIVRDLRAEQEADWAVQNSALMASDPNWQQAMERDLRAHPERYAQSWSASTVDMSGYRAFDPTSLPIQH